MGILRHGVHRAMEDEATAIIARSLKTAPPEVRAGILTTSKENLRRSREILVSSGVPDPANRQGMYHRSSNPAMPWLNSRDGRASGVKVNKGTGMSSASPVRQSLAEFVQAHYFGDV